MNRQSILKVMGLLLIYVAITYSFVTNGFGVAPWNEWAVWEQGSEVMVMKRIEVDLVNRETSALGLASYEGDELTVLERLAPENISDLRDSAPQTFTPYESEIGGQAHFWSVIWRDLGCSSISCLHAFNSALSAGAVLAMYLAFSLIGARALGVAWLISCSLSPWIAFGARNLFWSPWLYFLPAIASVGLVLARSRRSRLIAGLILFIVFVLKYLMTGYHEISAFVMLAAAMPIISILFRRGTKFNIKLQLWNSLIVIVSSLAAFMVVVSVHAKILTGDIPSGLVKIWTNTVLRRSYGQPEDFDAVYSESLTANPIHVLWRYMWPDWWTDLLSFSFNRNGNIFSVSLGSASFMVLTVACVAFVTIRISRGDQKWIRDAGLMVMGFAIAAVWLMGAKAYANNHIFILFFLWYWLYVPVLIFVFASFVMDYKKRLASVFESWQRKNLHANLSDHSGVMAPSAFVPPTATELPNLKEC
ncbi:hypothetical protein HQ496_14430 [bacterium]|nr:hypothetical protein [bacterium]